MKAKPLHAPAAAALLSVIACATAHARTPCRAPSDVGPRAGTTALDASFSEAFFVPDVAPDNAYSSVRGRRAPDALQVLETGSVVDHALAGPGTCRVSSGHRHGAMSRTRDVRRRTTSSRAATQPLLGHLQSGTRAGSCVTVGAPHAATLAPHGEGREIVPLAHPGDLSAGERFAFDGRPLPDRTVEVTEAVWTPDRTPPETSLPADAQGRARLPLEQAGTVLALVRHRRPAPAGAPVPEDSNRDTPRVRVREQ